VVKLLLEADVAVVVDKNECKATALHLAAQGGNKAIVEQLIKGNANVKARCQDG